MSADIVLAGRVIDTKYPAKACAFCTATPTTYAVLEGTAWASVCAKCATSHKHQILGLLSTVDEVVLALPAEQQTAFLAGGYITPDFEAQCVEALDAPQDASQAARAVVPKLQGMLSVARAMSTWQATTTEAVRPNKFPSACQTCKVTVEAGAGSLTSEGGRWVTRHLAGACPVAATAAVAQPMALSEAKRSMPNRKAAKCFACSTKVEIGKGYAVLDMPDAHGWAVLHDECAESLHADRLAIVGLLTNLGHHVIAATGSDTRDHAVRLAVDFVTGDGDGSQPLIFLRAAWGAAPTLELHTGAPGDIRRTPMGARRAQRILTALLTMTPERLLKAQADYGKHLQHCGRCGSPLTDATSRALGLGPDCASK